MKSKQYFLSILIALLNLAPLYAQSSSDDEKLTPEERAQKWTDWMKTEIQVSAEQETKVHDINLSYARQMESVRATGTNRKQKFKEARAIDKSKDEELKQVFTSDQFNLYQKKKSDMRKKMFRGIREQRK